MKTVIYYLVTTAFAIVLGLILGSVIEPGAGMNLPAEGLVASAKDAPPLMQVIVNIFPTNPIESMLKADMLQIIVLHCSSALAFPWLANLPILLKTPLTALPKYPTKL